VLLAKTKKKMNSTILIQGMYWRYSKPHSLHFSHPGCFYSNELLQLYDGQGNVCCIFM